MIRLLTRLVASIALSAASMTAQLHVEVTAVSELRVSSWNGFQQGLQTLPPGSDLTNGFALSAVSGPHPQNAFVSRGNSGAVTQQTAETYTFELSESASGGFGFLQTAGIGSWGPHQIEFAFSHPTARAMELVIERCLSPSPPSVSYSVSGSLSFPDGRVFHGTPSANAFNCIFTPFAEVDVVPITIDQGVTRFVLNTDGGAIGSIRGGTSASGSWRITLRPDTGRPCASIAYGQGCGPLFDVVEDPTLGPYSYRATLDDPALPSAAWLVGGGTRTTLPLPPSCDLLNDALVILPWPIDAQGYAELVLAAVPGQMFSLQLQAATFANDLRLSNGFEFACR